MPESVTAFQPEDIFKEQRIEEVDRHPSESVAVCSVKSVKHSDDTYESQLWRLPLDGGSPGQLTFAPGHSNRPRWSPRGDLIAFLSDRHGGPPQLYLLDAGGGEARQVTRFSATVVDHRWRPDGKQIALVCSVNVDRDRRTEGTEDIDLQRKIAPSSTPEVVWRLPYKMDGVGYNLGTRLHVVLVDVSTGEATALTKGDFNVGHVCWSSDGRRLAFTRTRDTDRESHCSDVWVLDIGVKTRPYPPSRRLTSTVSTASWPAWSPDGHTIAFLGAKDSGDAILRLWTVEVGSGVVRPIGHEDLELSANELFWNEQGSQLRAIQATQGRQRIAAIDMPSGEVQGLVEARAGHVTALSVGPTMVYVEEGVDHPIDVHQADRDGRQQKRISDFNAWWRERTPLTAQSRRFEVPDGEGGVETIQGWLLMDPTSQQPRRLLVDVHGGPASYVMLQYATAPYWQVLASQGWAILALNAVGSASFGRRFSERLRRSWGRLDLPQQLAAVETLRREGIADERVAIAGSSYGGYFSAYATGNCDEFRAAVVSAPVGNLETHYGTSDSGYYADPYSMEGKPEADRDLMLELSPMAHIARSRTPTLFLQGKEDERCPKCQSEEMFVKLRRSGTTTEMVLYPGGDHHTLGKGRPSHRLDGHQRIVEWLNRWVDQPLRATEDDQGADDRAR